jgi:hypothetical protein
MPAVSQTFEEAVKAEGPCAHFAAGIIADSHVLEE